MRVLKEQFRALTGMMYSIKRGNVDEDRTCFAGSLQSTIEEFTSTKKT